MEIIDFSRESKAPGFPTAGHFGSLSGRIIDIKANEPRSKDDV